MILLLAICSYQIRPVIISFCCINIFDFGAVIAPKSTPIRIFHLISRMSELVRRLQGCITLETIVGPFVATHKFRHIGYGFVTVISVVSNLNFSFVFNARSCLLGCNHHNAVCCAWAIDSGRGSIFQDVDFFYIGRIQEVHVVANHSVDNVQRFATGHRTLTADSDVKSFTGAAWTLRNVHTGNRTLQGFHNWSGTFSHNLIAVYTSNRTGYIRLFLYTVTYHHHFIQCLRIFFQCYLNVLLAAHCNGLRDITDKWYLDFCIGLYTEFEITVNIGNYTVGRTYFQYVCTDNRFTCTVDYGTWNLVTLCKGD